MTLLEFIRSYLAIGTFARLIENRVPVVSPVFSRVFTTRVNRAVSTISLTQITRITKSMPVISRGGMALPIDPKNAANTWIEPLSIRLSDWITGATLNSLRALYGSGDEQGQALVRAELDKMILDLMNTTERTRNALCAQALTGNIDYQMDSNGMKERYQISYGATNSYTLTTKLDDASATLVDLYNVLLAMRKTITDSGYSGTVEVMAGPNAFSTIANLIMATDNSERMGARFENDSIHFLGYTIILNDSSYTDTDASTGKEKVVPEIGTNKVVMYIPAAAELDYCAIDDVAGNLQATPFFSKVIEKPDPSGYQVISESKPMPLIAAKSVCWAEVTTGLGRRTNLTIINNNTIESGSGNSDSGDGEGA